MVARKRRLLGDPAHVGGVADADEAEAAGARHRPREVATRHVRHRRLHDRVPQAKGVHTNESTPDAAQRRAERWVSSCAVPGSLAQTVVMKFGGSSVADAERIKRAAGRIVAAREEGNNVVAVLSARGKTTDELVGMAFEVSELSLIHI